MRLARGGLVLLLANAVAISPAAAQLVGDRVEANCSSVARGNVENSTVTVICGMPHDQVVELVRLAASASAGDRAALMVQLRAIAPANSRFPVEAVARFLEILREQPVDDAKLADRFTQIAQEHVRLLQEIRALQVADPNVQALREAAVAALQGAPDHTLARAKLEEARDLVRAKRRTAAKVLADQQREEAALVREQAKVESARLRFAEAAQLYEQAAQLLPAEDRDQRGADWSAAGISWTDQDRDFGNNSALGRAIEAHRAALEERTRARVPLQWATTQNALGIALAVLGERESGTARLEEAVAAWELCLTVVESAWPQDWVQSVRKNRDEAQAEIRRRQASKR